MAMIAHLWRDFESGVYSSTSGSSRLRQAQLQCVRGRAYQLHACGLSLMLGYTLHFFINIQASSTAQGAATWCGAVRIVVLVRSGDDVQNIRYWCSKDECSYSLFCAILEATNKHAKQKVAVLQPCDSREWSTPRLDRIQTLASLDRHTKEATLLTYLHFLSMQRHYDHTCY